jgi:hypothetical protein
MFACCTDHGINGEASDNCDYISNQIKDLKFRYWKQLRTFPDENKWYQIYR